VKNYISSMGVVDLHTLVKLYKEIRKKGLQGTIFTQLSKNIPVYICTEIKECIWVNLASDWIWGWAS
jgi:hypothetical protein